MLEQYYITSILLLTPLKINIPDVVYNIGNAILYSYK